MATLVYPDTLDVVKHINLGINYLIRNPDAKSNYVPYFGGKVPYKGYPRLERTEWDYGDGTGRFIEALILARMVTGNQDGKEIEEMLIRNLYSFFKDDGLSYREKTPWNDDCADIWAQRGSLLALSLLYKTRGDREALNQLKRLLRGLEQVAIKDKEGSCFGYLWTGNKWIMENEGICFVPMEGLVKCFEMTGNEEALNLSISLANKMVYGRDRYFNEDGSFGCWQGEGDLKGRRLKSYEVTNGHVHSRTNAIFALLQLGILTGNKDYIAFGKKVYDWVRTQSSRFGWVPENLITPGKESSEMCCFTDMLGIQLLLAKIGYSEYWDHVEQYVRNHLVEAQFIVTPVIKESIMDIPKPKFPQDTPRITYREVLERLEGGFAGPIYPNDLFSAYPNSRENKDSERLIDISGCCAPSGIKALYFAWSNIVTKDDKGIWINLALNHTTEWVEIISNIPYEGRLDILIHEALPLYIRIPTWVCKDDVELFVNEKEERYEWVDRYIYYRRADRGDRLRIQYPLREMKEAEVLAGTPYEVSWKGDYVTDIKSDITPIFPLYMRREIK